MALLPSGKVLIAGGLVAGAGVATAERYDPVARTFQPTTHPMTTARQQASMTLLLNGTVLIAGGFDQGGGTQATLGSAEIYDPALDTFTVTAGSLGTPRWGHGAQLLPSGDVLIEGGGGAINPGAELYNPATQQFAPLGASALAQNWETATPLPGGDVFLALNGSLPGTGCVLFNPSGNTAVATANAGLIRDASPSASLLGDGTVLISGNTGLPGAEVPADGEIFNPATGTFRFTGNLGDRGEQTSNLLPSGRVLLAGGFQYARSSYGVLATAVLFDAGPAVPAPAPAATLTAATGPLAANSTGHSASVPATAGVICFWSIQGGTITAGAGTPAVTFTAGAAGTLTLDCLVVSGTGIPAHGQAILTVQ
jgi:hypothetical protein